LFSWILKKKIAGGKLWRDDAVTEFNEGATSVDRVLGLSKIKLLNPELSELVKIFTKQKQFHGLLHGERI